MLMENEAIELLDVASFTVLVSDELHCVLGLVDPHLVPDLVTTCAYFLHFQLSFPLLHQVLLSLLADAGLVLKLALALDLAAVFCASLNYLLARNFLIIIIIIIRYSHLIGVLDRADADGDGPGCCAVLVHRAMRVCIQRGGVYSLLGGSVQ